MDIRVAITNTAIFLAVYALVLGVPFGLAVIGKEFFIRLAGENWFFLPMLALLVLATIGPYILKKLQSKAEQEILKDQEVYQRVLEAFSSELDRYETTDEIVQHAGTILYKSMQLKNLAFYLRNNGGLILQKTNTDELSYKAEITDIEKINWDLNRNKAVLLKELEGYSQNGHNFNEFLQLTEAALVVPLIHHRKLKGFLFLGEKKNGSLYSRSDFISLSGLAHSLAMQLEYAEILKARTKRIEQEMHDQRLKDLGLFSAKVAHQMNNRLGRITGNLDGFRFYFTDDVLRNAPREKLVEKINRLLKSIPVILKDAMSASQISKAITTSAKTGTEPAVYKLKGLVDGGRALAETKHPHFRYEFIDEYDPEIKVWANDTIIQDVFSTGIDNSLYAMRKKQAGPEYAPQLTVKASVKDGIVTIELTDNGSGIKEEDKQYLFVPLFTSKGTDEGTGFGLANMKTMIEGQGGTIRIDSEQNKWTTLTITLPEPTVEQSKKKEGV